MGGLENLGKLRKNGKIRKFGKLMDLARSFYLHPYDPV